MRLKIDPEWLRVKYCDEGLSCKRITELLGNKISRQTVYKKLIKIGIKPRSKKDRVFYVDGERCIVSQGYFWIWNPTHPRANGGYVKRCVLNLEKKLGRMLNDGEFPHHIDNNRMNDDLENLDPSDRSNHMKLHRPIIDRWKTSKIHFHCPNKKKPVTITFCKHRHCKNMKDNHCLASPSFGGID